MLTKEHAITHYNGREIIPDRLCQKTHWHYLNFAEKMLDIYHSGIGMMRKELHTQVRKLFNDEPDCPPKRIDAFCKLLDEAGVYDLSKGKESPSLRIKLFRLAAPYHPLVQSMDRLFDHSEEEVKRNIAEKLKKNWAEIEADMFADLIEFHRLKKFDGYPGPAALLSKYNVAQVQAALFQATQLIIHINKDFKTILTYAKLARLMHTIQLSMDGKYRITLNGPASVLRHTQRYGINFAKFLPALLVCKDWEMEALMVSRRRGFIPVLRLSDKDKLKSHLPAPEEFDSSFEKTFAEKWGDEPREGWTLTREGCILHQRQKIFIPDFLLTHRDGRKVYLEIVGFWTPEYLNAKAEVLQLFKDQELLVAVAEASAKKMAPLPKNILLFNSSLSIKDVLLYLSTV